MGIDRDERKSLVIVQGNEVGEIRQSSILAKCPPRYPVFWYGILCSCQESIDRQTLASRGIYLYEIGIEKPLHFVAKDQEATGQTDHQQCGPGKQTEPGM